MKQQASTDFTAAQEAIRQHGERLARLPGVLAVRPGFARRTWGLPFLTFLCRSERADAERGRRHRRGRYGHRLRHASSGGRVWQAEDR